MSNLPCLYLILTETTLFRSMVDPITSRPYKLLDREFSILTPIRDWDMPDIKFVELTQGYGRTPLKVRVHGFSQSALNLEGMPPNTHYMFKHPYGFVDIDETERAIGKFITDRLPDYVREKIDEKDEFSTTIFRMAYRIRQSVPVSLVFCKEMWKYLLIALDYSASRRPAVVDSRSIYRGWLALLWEGDFRSGPKQSRSLRGHTVSHHRLSTCFNCCAAGPNTITQKGSP